MPHDPLQHALTRLAVSPSLAFKYGLRKRLLRHGRDLGMAPSAITPFTWALRFGSTAFGLALIVSGALAYEDPGINRNSPLFLLKRLGESIEVSVAQQRGELVDVYLRIADRRLAESEEMAADGIVDAPTIAEVKSSTEQALAAARVIETVPARNVATQKVARASRQNAATLRSVSITAQVATKKPVITLQKDLVAIAPPPPSVAPGSSAPSEGEGVSASQPREGTVAGSALVIPPSPTSTVPAPEDPAITVLDEAIASSTSIADDAGAASAQPEDSQGVR